MMKSRTVVLFAMFVGPAYAVDDAMEPFTDLCTKWQTAYNSGDSSKVGELYTDQALFSSEVIGTMKGRLEIVRALTNQMPKTPKIMLIPREAHIEGAVAWGIGDFSFTNGPSGHYGMTFTNDFGAWHILMHVSNVTAK